MDPVNESPRVLGNRYEVGDLLGRGGMAEVHLGRDTRLGRVVAIKLLRTDLARDATFQARFRREAQSAAALNHPAIVSVYDTGEEHVTDAAGTVIPLPYIVMEYVEGRTLRELLNEGDPLDVGLALEVTAGVLSALEYSHRAGIVHRDIKPANVMLTPNGDVKVMDFGIARALADATSNMTQTQAVIGTAQYLSPEQARGETVDARSDLYSAGCLLYELITGRPPFVADSPVAVAYQHVREEPQPPSVFNPLIPEAVDRIVLHSLAKDRETRYQTAAAFRADIDAARTGRPVGVAAGVADPNATTAYFGAAAGGTRAMTAAPVGPPTMQGSMLPGLPPVDEDDRYPVRRDPRADEEPPRRRGWLYALLALAVLLVFGGLAYAYANVFNRPNAPVQVRVPIVIGQTYEQASAALTRDGFVPQRVDRADDAEAGEVLDQDPRGDVLIARGSEVTLTVSSGPDSATVPDVARLTQQQAREQLEAAGLRVGDATAVDVNAEEGTVVRTEPKSGATVEPGSTVALFIASGSVKVPDVQNLTEEEARQRLAEAGLQSTPQDRVTDRVEPGKVVGTNPTPGSKVDRNAFVTILVAVKPEPTPTDTPSPSITDTDNDGQPDPTPSDTNGDGQPDPPATPGDGNGDGQPDQPNP